MMVLIFLKEKLAKHFSGMRSRTEPFEQKAQLWRKTSQEEKKCARIQLLLNKSSFFHAPLKYAKKAK